MEEVIRLHEGELNVMELLWANERLAAKDIAAIIKDYVGWEKNTTYTVINRLIAKGAIKREDPGYYCKAAITKKEMQKIETDALIDKVYGGKIGNLFTEYLRDEKLQPADLITLENIVREMKRFVLK